MTNFSKENFKKPPAVFSPAFFWMINDELDVDELKDQLQDMHAHGIRSVCLHPLPREFRPASLPTDMSPPYLSDEYLHRIKFIVEECERLKINYWFYDEGGWPSGSACGQVMARNPEKFASAFVENSESGPVVRDRIITDANNGTSYPNVLTPGVTEAFLELTHERHRQVIGKHFGKTICFAFTDEPRAEPTRLGHLTWTADLPEVFRQKKGYEFTPWLPDLLQQPSDSESQAITQVRIDFYDVWSQLFVERFLNPIKQWCRQNNLLSGGHFGGEDETDGSARQNYGHILRALRGLDVPGTDVIWRQLFPGQCGQPFMKYASSISHQADSPYALSEIFAVYGNGITPAQMKWLSEYQVMRGATLLVLSCFSQSLRNHQFYCSTRPQFGPPDPLWKYFDLYCNYFHRLSFLMSCGRPVISTAFYYDIRSIWAGGKTAKDAIHKHETGSAELLKRQCDFDYIDDDVLAEGKVRDGTIKVGAMTYDTLIIPSTKWMTAPALCNLENFKAAGGKVLDSQQLEDIEPVVRVSPECKEIRACKRLYENSQFYYVVNESDREIKIDILLPEKEKPVLADPATGEFYPVEFSIEPDGTRISWTFDPFGSAVFFVGLESDAQARHFGFNKVALNLEVKCSLRPLVQHKLLADGYKIVECNTPARKATLGDWRPYLGEYFSGDVEYIMEFNYFADKPALIDLGEVCYAVPVQLAPSRK